jgi:hypothetical protein
MNRICKASLFAAALMSCCVSTAFAWHLSGHVICKGTGLPFSNIQIDVVTTDGGPAFSSSAITDDSGYYFITLLEEPRDYRADAAVSSGTTVFAPSSGFYAFSTTSTEFEFTRDWVLDSPECTNSSSGLCWLTGGGAKFSPITETNVGDYTREHNWGGNVNPGCSPTAGDGGSWNDIAALLKLHFHGQAIQVVRCGNVDGIPPGSTSPATPFNFIEFEGTGTLKGIKGNKADYGTVHFFARCEDRNEPGSNGQRDGAGKDRYFLHVFANTADPNGSTLLLVDVDGDPATVDPVTITDGNMQIHISSCDAPPTALAPSAPLHRIAPSLENASGEVSFAMPRPNPTIERSLLSFALPRDAQVSLAIFDVTGRRMVDLARGGYPAGVHAVTWNLRSRDGTRVPGGIYFARLSVEGRLITHSLVVSP